ncbi:MAG: ABC transporter ATP-binding protein [Candidatus Harrisonbacteria bacterium]|nr:ABC transporter ATP-binding protein [Candidatus Harrisonbacteria bacterium]
MEPIISLHKINKTFKERPDLPPLKVLEDINLEVFDGEFLVLVGPSGSGKSTLLRIMSGLEKSYDGEVKLKAGISSADTSFVFQQFALLPWLTVEENIELGLIGRKISKNERKRRVAEELKLFGLEQFKNSRPKELSGGMRQRVGIARAIVTNPKIIFMDEPFSELDSFTAEELRKELLNIWQKRKPTIVMVTHIISEALKLGDRVAVLTPRPGKIEKVTSNSLPRPRAERSGDFYKLEDELYSLIKP